MCVCVFVCACVRVCVCVVRERETERVSVFCLLSLYSWVSGCRVRGCRLLSVPTRLPLPALLCVLYALCVCLCVLGVRSASPDLVSVTTSGAACRGVRFAASRLAVGVCLTAVE